MCMLDNESPPKPAKNLKLSAITGKTLESLFGFSFLVAKSFQFHTVNPLVARISVSSLSVLLSWSHTELYHISIPFKLKYFILKRGGCRMKEVQSYMTQEAGCPVLYKWYPMTGKRRVSFMELSTVWAVSSRGTAFMCCLSLLLKGWGWCLVM